MKMIVFLALMGLAKPALAEYDIGKAVADSLTQSHIEQQAREAGVPEKDIARSRLYESSGTLSPADAAMLDSMMKIFRDEK